MANDSLLLGSAVIIAALLGIVIFLIVIVARYKKSEDELTPLIYYIGVRNWGLYQQAEAYRLSKELKEIGDDPYKEQISWQLEQREKDVKSAREILEGLRIYFEDEEKNKAMYSWVYLDEDTAKYIYEAFEEMEASSGKNYSQRL